MFRVTSGRLWLIVVGLTILGVTVYAFLPRAVSVETTVVSRGPIVVAVSEEGRARVRERFTLSAPVAGRLLRIGLRAGDRVEAGDVVAAVLSVAPSPLDPRTLAGLRARVLASEASLEQTRALRESALAALEAATDELERQRELVESGTAPREGMEVAATGVRAAEANARGAASAVVVAEHVLEEARAALLAASTTRQAGQGLDIQAPHDGVVLRIFEESERVVAAGTPLLELGDPGSIELVADVLSTDAVRVTPGNPVLVERWGGPETLGGVVRRVEPSSFTKISALGVEEQRVNVIVDLTDPPDKWRRLGDGFAVEIRILVDERADVLTVPVGALFRSGQHWAAFTVRDDQARMTLLTVGLRGDLAVEVREGVAEGDRVILHPDDAVEEGVEVVLR